MSAKTFNQIRTEQGHRVAKRPTGTDAGDATDSESAVPAADAKRALLHRLNEIVSAWVGSRDFRNADVYRDEGILRTIQGGEGADIARQLLGMDEPPALAKRLAKALGLPDGTVKKATGLTFGQIVRARQLEKAKELLKDDPFADVSASLAGEIERAVVAQRPDLAALPFAAAVRVIDKAYPGLIDGLIARSGYADGKAALQLEKAARALMEADDDLTVEKARALAMDEDPDLRNRVLKAERGF